MANLPDALLRGEKLSLKLCLHIWRKGDQYEVCAGDDDDDDGDDDDDSHRPTGLTNKPCD